MINPFAQFVAPASGRQASPGLARRLTLLQRDPAAPGPRLAPQPKHGITCVQAASAAAPLGHQLAASPLFISRTH
jgi:hypothetical protein